MTVTLNLKPDAEAKLCDRARSEGLPVDAYVEKVVQSLLNGPIDIGEPDYLDEDDIPELKPLRTYSVKASMIVRGPLQFPAIDEDDLLLEDG